VPTIFYGFRVLKAGISMSDTRILIVDDEEDLRDVLSHQLRGLGAKIELAENGRVALEKVASTWYDAILSDISMPEMNGLELLHGLRSRSLEIPFVILTGFGDKAKAVEALRLGAFDFLEKPWEPESLRRTMGRAIELGLRLRDLERELDEILAGFENVPEESREKIRKIQKSLLLMKLHKGLIGKKTA
jgi:DNA-binding NtrC family response regulator